MRPTWRAATKHASGSMATIYACLRKANPGVPPLQFFCKGCGSLISLHFKVRGPDALDNRVIEAILAGKGQKDARLNQGATHKIGGATEVPIERGFDPAIDFVICT